MIISLFPAAASHLIAAMPIVALIGVTGNFARVVPTPGIVSAQGF